MEWLNKIGDAFYRAVIEKERYWYYLEGMKNTLIIAFCAVILGCFIGILIALVKFKAKDNPWLKPLDWLCNMYIYIVRGTPVFLQLFIIYYMVFNSRDSIPIVSGIVCFAINSGAYVAEIMRAGIESIDKGQMEAARSLGLSQNISMVFIVLPQAIKNILPALGNEFIVLVKETAIVGAITVTDVTKAAQYIGSTTYDVLPPLFVAAAFYLVIVYILTAMITKLERRLGKGDRR